MSDPSNTATTPLHPPLSTPGYRVDGRVFVISGGNQGLGLGIARQLADRGARGLVLVGRNAARGQEACDQLHRPSQCTCHFIQADLRDAHQASTVIDRAVEALGPDAGPISGVVNAAATTARGNLQTTTAEAFDEHMALNVRAPFLITQAAARHMTHHEIQGGAIVNIGSVAGLGGAPFIMAYSASKAALHNLTKTTAAELAPHGIRVNGVTLGWCLTDNEHALQTAQSGDPRWMDSADADVPLGRILRPADVAATVGFLLSENAAMMSGAMIPLHPDYAHGMISLLSEDTRM